MSEIVVTQHAQRRMRGRLGLPDDAMHEIARQALLEGRRSHELPRRLRHYINRMQLRTGQDATFHFYMGYVFIFRGWHLITAIRPPKFIYDGDAA